VLFTATPPERQGDQVRLYFSPDDAAREGHRVLAVAVHYDGSRKRLTAVGNLYRGIEPGWTSPATHQTDGCLVVRGPIPASLFSNESLA
jgi:hypothetical protein